MEKISKVEMDALLKNSIYIPLWCTTPTVSHPLRQLLLRGFIIPCSNWRNNKLWMLLHLNGNSVDKGVKAPMNLMCHCEFIQLNIYLRQIKIMARVLTSFCSSFYLAFCLIRLSLDFRKVAIFVAGVVVCLVDYGFRVRI